LADVLGQDVHDPQVAELGQDVPVQGVAIVLTRDRLDLVVGIHCPST